MNHIKLVCLGDSLTEGYGIPQTARWSDLLLKDLEIEIINQGISGDTTGGMLARFQMDVLSEKPTHLIIMGGTNDLSFGLSPKLILSNYHSMLRQARRAGIQTIIGLPTVVFYDGFIDEENPLLFTPLKELSEQIDAFRKQLILYAKDQDLPIIDFSKNMTPKQFLADGVHPNEAGNLTMMKNAKTVLEKIITT